ncbi:methyltransferase [Clostridium saudiense]|uniref:methyltransferase n=1 Tax=Clostridium saudiense TaxID=1414720 RepID=UPI0018ABFDCC|nr:methyltransferase [Clostridium saudiense]
MDKVLIDIFLPAINRSFEVYIPLDSKFYEITPLVSKMLSELSNGLFISGEDSILYERKTGNILNINMSARQLNIKNGDNLMLL